MIKYTPGPWEVDESNPNLVARLVDGVYEYVCEVAPSSFSTRECSDEQEEADARLIAAAPELLEALQNLEGQVRLFCEQYGEADFETGQARAAIAKAGAA
jgi:hypothetical protein